NGGGVWSCEAPNGELIKLMFMDIFEARREYQLNVPEVTADHLSVVQSQKEWLQNKLTAGSKIQEHIEYVEKNITWIDDIIVSIPDAANKITPHPSLCKQGKWVPVQLVNFTDDFRILVRKEIFNSPLLTEMERAAVYLHEGIYSYMRTEFGDTTSVRTRAIVGVLFSDLNDNEKVERVEKILKQQNGEPSSEKPAEGFICGLKPNSYSALYTAEAKEETKARTEVVESCKKGQNPFPPGFPGGISLPGPGMECKDIKVSCEKIMTQEKRKTCNISISFRDKVYTGKGRTQLEAQKEAIAQCLVSEGSESTCYQSDSMNCIN
ncbi:MAG: hypothetical protein ACXVCN_07730, partial [Bdellovibrio sp.]